MMKKTGSMFPRSFLQVAALVEPEVTAGGELLSNGTLWV